MKNLTAIFIIILAILIGIFTYYKVIRKPHQASAVITTTKSDDNNVLAGEKTSFTREEIEQIIEEHIIDNPDIIVKSLDKLRKQKDQESNQKAEDYIKNNMEEILGLGNPPVIGNKNGAISIVFFYDYNCGFCKEANKTILNIIKTETDIKITFRPIAILGPHSTYATKLSLVIHKAFPDKFFAIHNSLMSTKELITPKVGKAILAKYNIDYSIVENEINSLSSKALINKNLKIAQNLGIRGAPSYVIGNYFTSGLMKEEKLKIIFAELRKQQKMK
ncbi:MAG: DsbA family protein [Rickettsiaceae bacterium]|nr:DsbA family protein [Rickettsiaceae bacterium]